jgi:hypothetical protein
VVIHNRLLERGLSESHLSILQHVGAAIPPEIVPARCDEIFALYFVARVDG